MGALASDLRKSVEPRPRLIEKVLLRGLVARFLWVRQVPRNADILSKDPLRWGEALLAHELVRHRNAFPRNCVRFIFITRSHPILYGLQLEFEVPDSVLDEGNSPVCVPRNVCHDDSPVHELLAELSAEGAILIHPELDREPGPIAPTGLKGAPDLS